MGTAFFRRTVNGIRHTKILLNVHLKGAFFRRPFIYKNPLVSPFIVDK